MAEENEEKIKVEVKAEEDSGKETKSRNPWIYSTIIFLLIAIALSGIQMSGMLVATDGTTGGTTMQNQISPEAAGQKAVNFINENLVQPGSSVTLDSVTEMSGVYNVTTIYSGREIPVYVTKDGRYLMVPGIGAIDMDNFVSPEPQEAEPEPEPAGPDIPKSDRPKVELFIWSYCPYGVQAQGPLADVASLLGENADFEAVLYYDGHGAYETQQNKIQACIQEVAEDKYWEYAAGFVENIYTKCSSTRDVECDKTESVELMKSLGIDDSEVMSCVENRGEDLIAEHSTRAREYGITGSPSLVINGLKVNTARNSEAFKVAVCEAFNDAPEECSETLSSSSTAASGNC